MKKDVRIILIDTCGWIVVLSIIVFFFTLWLFSYNNIEEPLKETWSITFSALSALATIGAAIIAASLFNDWKEQHNKTILAPEAITTYKSINLNIKQNAEYMLLVKRNINKPIASQEGVSIYDKFGLLMDTKADQIVNLKYFATLAQSKEINSLIYEYNSCVDTHFAYLNKQYRSQSTSFMDQSFINKNHDFIKDLTSIQLAINVALSNYILFK